MKKLSIGVGIIAVLAGAYWLAAPLFFDNEVQEAAVDIGESASAQGEQIIVAEGSFADADAFHKGAGVVRLISVGGKNFIRFEDDFKVTNGPDLFVYFGKDGAYASEAKIAALKGNIGSQNYEVPEGMRVDEYNEVWIWCRAFSVPFAHAILLNPSASRAGIESGN